MIQSDGSSSPMHDSHKDSNIHPVKIEGRAPFRSYETWYCITGSMNGTSPPLVILHGGPGMAHNYLLNFRDLASEHRAVIHYDQIGCGLSTHLPDAPVEFWSISLFLDELDNLLKHLNISSCYDLLGHSWGGMLACEHAVKQPSGLRCLILASSPSDIPSGLVEVKLLCDQFPSAIQETFLKHEEAGTTESDEYQAGVRVFYNHFVCRVPVPPEFEASVSQYTQDPTVYLSMWGPSEFYVTGILKEWSVVDRLHLLKVPTLIYSGLYDEITPRTQVAFLKGIRSNVRQVLFNESSHTPHIEERTKTMATIADFLDADKEIF